MDNLSQEGLVRKHLIEQEVLIKRRMNKQVYKLSGREKLVITYKSVKGKIERNNECLRMQKKV
jgi:hypothetical protein